MPWCFGIANKVIKDLTWLELAFVHKSKIPVLTTFK